MLPRREESSLLDFSEESPYPAWQQKVWRLAKLPLRERALAGWRARGNKDARLQSLDPSGPVAYPAWQQKQTRLAFVPLRERALAGQRARTNKAQLRDLIAEKSCVLDHQVPCGDLMS